MQAGSHKLRAAVPFHERHSKHASQRPAASKKRAVRTLSPFQAPDPHAQMPAPSSENSDKTTQEQALAGHAAAMRGVDGKRLTAAGDPETPRSLHYYRSLVLAQGTFQLQGRSDGKFDDAQCFVSAHISSLCQC